MSNRAYVATRKGVFTIGRSGDGRWSVDRAAFLGNNATITSHDPRDGAIYAALDHGHFGVKLHRSDDQGETWKEVATPAYPKAPEGTPEKDVVALKLVWSLEPGGAPGELWCGTIPGALFHSTDRGESWRLVQSLWDDPLRKNWFGGGADQPGIHSVCVHPGDGAQLAVGVSCGGVWVSRDRGESWALRADGMRAEFMPPDRQGDPSIQDPHRVVRCPAQPDALWAQHHNGIFRTTDGGASWREISCSSPSSFGFAVAVHPKDPETAWFVPARKDEYRYPVDGNVVVTRTRDGGRSFEVLTEGLPRGHAYDLVFRHALDIDGTGERLIFGSTTGSLWVTENGGDSWQTISTHLPPIYCVRFA
jgi:photosystem II stability/assembly factor-like uncharacterized protein